MAPSANAETVEKAMGAFSRGELEEVPATPAPDVEWHLAFQLPDLPPGKTVFRGHDEARGIWTAFRSAWDGLVIDREEAEAEEGDALAVRVRFSGRGERSGIGDG